MTAPWDDDSGLLEAARAGDLDAFLALVGGHAAELYDFVAQVLGSQGAAMVLTGEALRRAVDNLAQAPVGVSPRAWLAGQAWPLLGVAAARGELQPPSERTGAAAEVAALGWERHAFLDLGARQGFSAAEVAVAAGISVASAATILERLPATLPGASGATEVLAVRYAVSPAAVPPVGMVAGWSRDVARWYGSRAAAPAGGVPLLAAPASSSRARWYSAAAVLVFLGATLGALAFIPSSPVAVTRGRDDGPAAAAPTPARFPTAPVTVTRTATRTPQSTPSSAGPTASTASPAATPTPSAPQSTPTRTQQQPTTTSTPTGVPTPSPSPTATVTPTVTPTPAATASPTPTASPTACAPTIRANVGLLTAPPGQATFFVVFNQAFCAGAPFSVEVDQAWLLVTPTSGSIPAGGNVQLSVTADPPAASGTYTATIRIVGASNVASVTVESTRP